MTIIDEVIDDLNKLTFRSKILSGLTLQNKQDYCLNKIKIKYGEIMYNKYIKIIIAVIDIVICETSINQHEIKRDIDLLFCDCTKKTQVRRARTNSCTN